MSPPRLYCRDLAPGSLTLSAEETHHAVSVLRATVGTRVVLFDGAGGEAEGVVERAGRRGLVVAVESVRRRPFELDRRLTLAVALPRQHRQSYVIEKCTELGVFAIQPIRTERSVTKPDADAAVKWNRRAIEAAKQCGRAWVPRIEAPLAFEDCLNRAREFDAVWLAHVDAQAVAPPAFLSEHPGVRTLLGLVGPEGGWTDGEIAAARGAGAVMVRLAPTILRTETAAVALCAAVAMCAAVGNGESA